MAEENSNLYAVLAYFLPILGGLAVLFMKKEDLELKFHSIQSIVFHVVAGIVWFGLAVVSGVLSILPAFGLILSALVVFAGGFVLFVAWLLLMYKAFKMEHFLLPVLGPFADAQAKTLKI